MSCYFIFARPLSSLSYNSPNRDQATSTDNNTHYQPLDFATDVSPHAAKRPSAYC